VATARCCPVPRSRGLRLVELGRGGESGLEDIGEFAGRTYDYYAAHPELIRLLLWENLSGGPVADEANRTAH
jgi:hypothetical protein